MSWDGTYNGMHDSSRYADQYLAFDITGTVCMVLAYRAEWRT